MDSDIVLSVPARAEYVHILRAVAAGVAARQDFSYDEIDDLRLAVDEACGQLFSVGGEGTSMTLGINLLDGGVDIRVGIDVEPSPWPPLDHRDSLTWQVLSALTDEAEFERSDHGAGLHLVKHRGGA